MSDVEEFIDNLDNKRSLISYTVPELKGFVRGVVRCGLNEMFDKHYKDHLHDKFSEFLHEKLEMISDDEQINIINRKIKLLFANIKSREKASLEIVENEIERLSDNVDVLFNMIRNLQNKNDI